MTLLNTCKELQRASRILSALNTKIKDDALKAVALSLQEHLNDILNENQKDIRTDRKSVV